ncbi:hypothetical protein [Hyphococcus sp.]|uniref:hypothetical protein n=1 Tax=Hyphococcus sp. TaxID=2038636 RepID=UPI003D0B4D89
MTVYLAYFDPGGADMDGFEQETVQKRLADNLYLIDSSETRSRLYHRIKRYLTKDAPLLVAPLDQAPKFKGLEDGALKWTRARFS